MKYMTRIALLALTINACSTKPPEDPGKASPPKSPKIVGSADSTGTSFDAKQLANEMESNHVTEIRFKKGSAELTPSARKSLAAVMTEAKKNKSLGVAKLITWADEEMPTEKKEALPEAQVELAQRRNDTLTEFIQGRDRDVDIDPISMALRPQGLKKLVPTEAARIQESLDETGVPEKGDKKEGMGKASRSIIIFTRK